MPASYPTSAKVFTTKNTNDTIQAAHINDLQAEVTAIETDLLAVWPAGVSAASGGAFSWTPVLTFATPGDLNVVYSTQVGRGKKVGSSVYLTATIITSTFTHTTSAGNCMITGNPFTCNASAGAVGSVFWQGITKASYTDLCASIAVGSSTILFTASGSAQQADVIDSADMPTGGAGVVLVFTLQFEV